mmetsp:Transcript_44324/g.79508  ORF Transcript_44324/g.79508 Transcript_44324/m.79508 type:complete len:239 (-) Transcript_44324:129-845(-)|eukprot:CAMPEP_0201918918 /NCGR_PEP_ID=MMETSP0903-20130614/7946_1 /ASSEMBLY_ACC=CAM_ASM_000552 /TAXON_ID=420261 /ORGANISM="Thalassiosira antarctica, Strain CCMP982" /LENGTH=238 /DNA_ID=CAMNT_0048455325 /DNA_START=26 /DNA_END=742 /DNA_ORIENTATION=-
MAKKKNATETTEESSVYDSILSTCCCGSSSADQNDQNSIARDKIKKKKLEQQQQQQQQQKEYQDFDKTPKFWERLSDVATFLVGGTPPVKLVECFECSSADGSELSLPRVLSDLADEYDKQNKWEVNSMWSISEDATAETAETNGDISDIHALSTETGIPRNRSGSSRWDRLRLKSNSSDRSRYTEDSEYSKRRRKSGISSTLNGAVNKKRIRGNWSRPSGPSGRSRRSNRSVSRFEI